MNGLKKYFATNTFKTIEDCRLWLQMLVALLLFWIFFSLVMPFGFFMAIFFALLQWIAMALFWDLCTFLNGLGYARGLFKFFHGVEAPETTKAPSKPTQES